MRIKGKSWKQSRCCGQRLSLKSVEPIMVEGLMVTEMLVCRRCGRGRYRARMNEQSLRGGDAGTEQA